MWSSCGVPGVPDDKRAQPEFRRVAAILAKRRTDLEPTARDDHWRRRLVSIGHDPLKPPRD